MELEGRKPRAPYTKAKVKKILTSWHIYALTALYVYAFLYASQGTSHFGAIIDACLDFSITAPQAQPPFLHNI